MPYEGCYEVTFLIEKYSDFSSLVKTFLGNFAEETSYFRRFNKKNCLATEIVSKHFRLNQTLQNSNYKYFVLSSTFACLMSILQLDHPSPPIATQSFIPENNSQCVCYAKSLSTHFSVVGIYSFLSFSFE